MNNRSKSDLLDKASPYSRERQNREGNTETEQRGKHRDRTEGKHRDRTERDLTR